MPIGREVGVRARHIKSVYLRSIICFSWGEYVVLINIYAFFPLSIPCQISHDRIMHCYGSKA